MLSRHVGAARFAFNQALRPHKDRDLNAAVNLAAWAESHTPPVADGAVRGVAQVGDRQAAGPVTNAHRQDTPTRHDVRRRGGTGLDDVGTSQTAPTA